MINYPFSEKAAKAQILYDGKGFVKVVLMDNEEMEVEDIKEQRELTAKLVNGKPHVVLAVAGERTSATKEARIYSSKNIPLGRVAEAVIIRSVAVKLMGNIYIKFHKPGVPTRLFDDEAAAEKWLSEKLKEAMHNA